MLLVERKIPGSKILAMEYKEYSENLNKEAEILFNKFKEDRVIVKCNYEDRDWLLTDEVEMYKLTFDFDEVEFVREAQSRGISSFIQFKHAVKLFLLYKLEKFAIRTIADMLRALKKIFTRTSFFNVSSEEYLKKLTLSSNDDHYRFVHVILQFLEFYNLDVHEDIYDILHYQMEQYQCRIELKGLLNQRNIGDFDSIFKFGEVMDLFWDNCSHEEREKYFPIKLWWEITTKIPLRVTEFTLTPYDCIYREGDHCFLTIRRSTLKGASGRVTHKVSKDYELHTIKINNKLFDLIEDYRKGVDPYDAGKSKGRRKYLLSYDSFYKYLEFKPGTEKAFIKGHFTSRHITKLLVRFYMEIVQEKFNYQVVSKLDPGEVLETFQIEQLSPMDTRHYSFINLVLNDIEPFIIKKISGHKKFESSYHYYSHVHNFVKCFTYSMARRLAKENSKGVDIIELNGHKHEIFRDATHIVINPKEVENGKCFSEQSFEEMNDCRNVNYQCYICKYYSPYKREEMSLLIKKNEELIETEIEAFQLLLRQYKKTKNLQEEFGCKLNRIKGLANQNAYLLSRFVY